ncbi:MAG: 4-hydroxy-tetrahydrodipicolinate synthase [Gammaproteobacteria bacterium HGW-Gammaproteobacteria-8]|nr:MAG: 4-hydroxy-tetrahydrodipicolinate synthase [Gammaproteobacteria bacterium HGW-Gammaproteobacteria-8]
MTNKNDIFSDASAEGFVRRPIQGSIVALVTPFRDRGDAIDLEAWRGLLDWHIESGTDAVVVAGTTGESATLDASERDGLLTEAVRRCAGRCAVWAGTGAASTRVAVAQSQRAAELGADALLVVTPYYNRPPQRGLVAHYRAVAEATELPVVLYNVPSRTAVDLAPESVLELAALPRIVAIKEAVPDMQRVRQYSAAGLTVLSGDDPSALEAMRNGAAGVVSVAANVVPARMADLCRAARAGQIERAETLDAGLRALYRFLGSETNPLPVKWLLAEQKRIEPHLRLPLTTLDAVHHAAGRELLARFSQLASGRA